MRGECVHVALCRKVGQYMCAVLLQFLSYYEIKIETSNAIVRFG